MAAICLGPNELMATSLVESLLTSAVEMYHSAVNSVEWEPRPGIHSYYLAKQNTGYGMINRYMHNIQHMTENDLRTAIDLTAPLRHMNCQDMETLSALLVA